MDETRSIITSVDGQPALEVQRPVLVFLEGTQAGTQHVLPEGPVVLGRGGDADVRLDDPSASRAHAKLTPCGDRWTVTDLGSKLGTFVADDQIETTEVGPGDVLRIGRTVLRLEVTTLVMRAPRPDTGRLGSLVGASEVMRDLFGLIRQVAPLDLPVTIQGETGTGKEGVARALHEESPRREAPYEVVDCTLLTGEHLRSELFGHVRGAFTGADSARVGAFERADGGTLFFDEVGELPLDIQPTLLRVLQEGEVRPLGGNASKRVTVRVISASHRDLAALVEQGKLRQDLFYRLAAIQLDVPPLRNRREDVEALSDHFLPDGHRLSTDARKLLLEHPWPGNVRELQQALRVAVAMSPDGTIEPEHLQLRPTSPQAKPELTASVPKTRAEFEEAELRSALLEAKHHRGRAAKILGIARSTLYERMKRFGIE